MNDTLTGLMQALADRAGCSMDELAPLHEQAAGDDLRFCQAAVDAGLLSERAAWQVYAEQLGLDFEPLDDDDLDQATIRRLPRDLAEHLGAIPLGEQHGMLRVALRDPLDLRAVDDLQEETGMPIETVVAPPAAIGRALSLAARRDRAITAVLKDPRQRPVLSDVSRLRAAVGEDAVAQLVTHYLEEALRFEASDLHFEPQGDQLRVRLRVDGRLRSVDRLPAALAAPIASRIKVLAGLDLGDTRRPQDGRIVDIEREAVELRVSTLPGVTGESLVLRVLDGRLGMRELGRCDVSPKILPDVEQMARAAHGLLLVTGPTGSGKSTTMRAVLAERDLETEKVVTIEDPVEYRVPGIVQVQVDLRAERSFDKALRAILRHDPDVVMVGEIRDPETAATAVQAALTGHLVISTLHTGTATAAVQRMIDLGVDPWPLSHALIGVLAQRLLPRNCDRCAEPTELPASLEAAMVERQIPVPENARWRAGTGCPQCFDTGERGRIAIHELLPGDPDRTLALARGDGGRAEESTAASGSLLTDAIRKAAAGQIAPASLAALSISSRS